MASTFVALDFNSQIGVDKSSLSVSPSDTIRIVFLSRLDPQKNLDYAIQLISNLQSPVLFDIYGNCYDPKYMQTLLKLLNNLPKHINISLKGPIPHKDVLDTLSKYDLFFLPTKNENFGHVIHEALLSGLPVLLSDQTPWHELESRNAGWEIPLDKPDLFIKTLEQFISLSKEQRLQMRLAALQYGIDISHNKKTLQDNVHMFESILNA